MPMKDGNGRWHDDRGRFMKVAAALAAVEKTGHSGGGQRGSLSRVSAKLAKTAEPKRLPNAKTPAEHQAALAAMTSRDAARQHLVGVKGKELDDLARSLNITGGTVAEKRERIVGHTVGSRLDSATLRGGTWDTSRVADRGRAVQDAVRESAARHANSGGWAGIADVRDDLAAAGYSRDEQDKALRAMLGQPDVRIVPVADRKNLKPRDRAAALVVGRDDLTAIQVGGDPVVPEVRTQVTVADLRADLAARERLLRLEEEAGAPEELLANHRAAIDDLRRQLSKMEGGSTSSVHAPTAEGIADAFYEAMQGRDASGWLSLTTLRSRLGGTREEQDRALIEGARARDFQLIPEEIQHAIRTDDQLAAVKIGGENKHLIAIHKGTRLHRGGDAPPPARKARETAESRPPSANSSRLAGVASRLAGKQTSPRPEDVSLTRSEKAAGLAHERFLGGVTSREQGREYLSAVKGQDLNDFLRYLNLGTSGTAAQKRQRVLQALVGARLDAEAIRRRSSAR